MPILESLPVKVRLIIEVDGHTLTFTEEGKRRAVGAQTWKRLSEVLSTQ